MEPINFSVTSSDDAENPLRFVLCPKDDSLKVGRSKKCGVLVDRNGVSWVHMEITPWTKCAEDAAQSLCVKDISSNGVGLRRTRGSDLQRLEKDVETEVPHGAVLVLPFRVKVPEGETEDSQRTFLSVSIDGVNSPSSELSDSEAEEAIADKAAPGNRDRSRSRSPRKDLFNPEDNPVVDGKSKKKAAGEKDKTAKKSHSFNAGEFVKVINLKGKVALLNGKVGLLVEFDSEKGAWKVRMEDGSGKAFRPANLRPHKVQKPTMPASTPSQPPPPSAPPATGQVTEPPPPPDEPRPNGGVAGVPAAVPAPVVVPPPVAVQPAALPRPPPVALAAVSPPGVASAAVSKRGGAPQAPAGFSKQSAVPATGPVIPKMPVAVPLMPMGVMPVPTLPLGMPVMPMPTIPLGMPMMPPLVGGVQPVPMMAPGVRMPAPPNPGLLRPHR